MRDWAWMVLVFAATAASGQSFVSYYVDGKNLTDPGRGISGAQTGDIFRFRVVVKHDAHSYAGGRIDVTMWTRFGATPDQFTVSEPNDIVVPPPMWEELGRHPNLRVATSDGPPDATQPRMRDVLVHSNDGTYRRKDVVISDDRFGGGTEWFDLDSQPPGLGGLSGPFPITSGDAIFVFDWVFDGSGEGIVRVETTSTALVYRNASEVEGWEVEANAGDLHWFPAPGSLSVLLLAGAMSRRRR